jgi:FKBP-type peptidyl-prolyl cis-trans isomerase SlyD
MPIAHNSVVSFHYTVATAEGEHVDKSEEGQPLVYMHGHGQIVPGLEAAMSGREAGEHIDTTVAPADAYGEHEEALDLQVPLDVFPVAVRAQIQPGFRFKAEHPTVADQEVVFTVHGIEGDKAFVSGNHPLAGKTLQFSIDVLDVRTASAEEISHGHAHGPGGHHHH